MTFIEFENHPLDLLITAFSESHHPLSVESDISFTSQRRHTHIAPVSAAHIFLSPLSAFGFSSFMREKIIRQKTVKEWRAVFFYPLCLLPCSADGGAPLPT